MNTVRRWIGASGAALVLLAAQLAWHGTPAATGAPAAQHHVTKIAPGLTLDRIVQKSKQTPRRIFVLKADIAQPLTIDVALSNDLIAGYETTSSMAARHGAIAAVNGDFGVSPGRPVHAFAGTAT